MDRHFHVWRQADRPWRMGPMPPRIFGPCEPLRRDDPIAEYLADTAGQGVVEAVYVQANWAPDQAEARFIADTARASGWPHATLPGPA